MLEPIALGRNSERVVSLLPKLANRHGCITGATGTGKTVSLQLMAEAFSRIGTPVFSGRERGFIRYFTSGLRVVLQKRLDKLGSTLRRVLVVAQPCCGMCLRVRHLCALRLAIWGLTSAQAMGLNDTQTGILNICFKLADDEGLLLLDLKDLRSVLQFVSDNARELRTTYGNIAPASVALFNALYWSWRFRRRYFLRRADVRCL